MYNRTDEAFAEAGAAAAPIRDASVLEMRLGEDDATFHPGSFNDAEAASPRRWLPLFENFSSFVPHAALAAGLLIFAWVAGYIISDRLLPLDAAKPQPIQTAEAKESFELIELRNITKKMAGEIRALQASVGAMHTLRSQSVKDAAAIESVKKRLDSARSEAVAAIAELGGKVEHIESETAANSSKVNERFDRIEHLISTSRVAPSRAVASSSEAGSLQKQAQKRRGDAFDPSKNPKAPGVPRPLGAPTR